MAKTKIEDIDLYALLDLQITANESEIKRAYRKKALQCHPDKNPDNPKAVETFHELSRALEILTDIAARAAYDKVLKAKAAAKIRNLQLDSKRKKLKEDLERREQEALYGKNENLTDAEKLAAEITRLQKQGSLLLQEEQRRVKEEILKTKEKGVHFIWDSSINRIKLKWKASKDDINNGVYNEETLKKVLKKYGEIVALIISPKKGTAIVEFSTQEASEMAVEFEKGLPEYPLTLKWVNKKPILKKEENKGPSTISDRDYESLVLTKMRQAAERQKLIDDMLKEDLGS